jgi:uncharacterized membrane protein YkoI
MKLSRTLAIALLLTGSAAAAQQSRTISVLEAVKIAERRGNAQVTDVDLDRWGERQVYEVDVVRGTKSQEFIIDARNGKILRQNSSLTRDLTDDLFNHSNATHLGKARKLSSIIASLESRAGGKVVSASFDVEDGVAYYEVDLLSQIGRTTIYLDPVDGKRLNFLPDD